MEKECLLTTFISGEKYQSFIPLLVYSCKRAYPEYDIMLFLHEPLKKEIYDLLNATNLLSLVIIKENVFAYDSKMTPVKACSYRWVLWDELFLKYNFIYIIDIDMFYIREPKPLHIQHKERMEISGLPFDNLKREAKQKRNLRKILRRIKYAHFHLFFKFISQKYITETRLSGLHFIDTHKYYTQNNRNYLDNIRKQLSKKIFFPDIMIADNEALLYKIVTELGYNCDWIGYQTSTTAMLPFENNLRKEFRPHHGIHLGIFKSQGYKKWSENTKKAFIPILESKTYKFYINEYKKIYFSEEFSRFFSLMPEEIKIYITRLNEYYNIH